MSTRVLFDFDDVLDVLTARLADARVVRARPSRTDSRLVLKLDASGHIVGIDLLGPTEMRPSFWRSHPDRASFPRPLLSEVDQWLDTLWARRADRGSE